MCRFLPFTFLPLSKPTSPRAVSHVFTDCESRIDADACTCLPSRFLKRAAQLFVQALPQPGFAPFSKIVIHGFPRRIISRQISPRATGTQQIKNPVQNLTPLANWFSAELLLLGQTVFEKLVFSVSQVRRINFAHSSSLRKLTGIFQTHS
jgi:hypothetical protein